MTEPPITDDKPGAAFRSHLEKWRRQQEGLRTAVRQPSGCEAVGSVLNGSRKTRWHTRRAATAMILGSLTIFTSAVAVGALSPLWALASLTFLTGLIALCKVELRQRRSYGRSFTSAPSKVRSSNPDSAMVAEARSSSASPHGDMIADPRHSTA